MFYCIKSFYLNILVTLRYDSYWQLVSYWHGIPYHSGWPVPSMCASNLLKGMIMYCIELYGIELHCNVYFFMRSNNSNYNLVSLQSSLSEVYKPANFIPPSPIVIPTFTGSSVRAASAEIINTRQIQFKDLFYDGSCTGKMFFLLKKNMPIICRVHVVAWNTLKSHEIWMINFQARRSHGNLKKMSKVMEKSWK